MAANHHILIGAKLMGYNHQQSYYALRAYLDAEDQAETVDTASLSPQDFKGWCYGRNTWEIENQQ